MHPETCCLREGVSPKARRNIPRAPLWSRSILRPSEDVTVFLPPSLWFISPVQLTVFEVYASLTISTVLPFSEALCFRNFLNRWWANAEEVADGLGADPAVDLWSPCPDVFEGWE